MNETQFDDVVVGAGIIGLAHAYHLARRGRKVLVCERNAKAQGASIRNFGMLWPIGQPPGERLEMALRSRAFWLKVLPDAGLWYEPVGSLHLAYHDDEAQVLTEFAQTAADNGFGEVRLLQPFTIGFRYPAVKTDGLHGALFSASEICVDPRQVVAELPRYLAKKFGVTFRFGTTVLGYDGNTVATTGGEFKTSTMYVCSGDDLQTLYPDVFAQMNVTRCKLQMLRTEPMQDDWRMGPMLAAGLTLRHYKSFAHCPTLPAVKERLARDFAEYDRYGIHVMASQNGKGELVLGDSHEYDDDIEIFDKEEIDRLVLAYLATFLKAEYRVAARWHGIYIKHLSEPYEVVRPSETVTIVAAVGGAGMTLSFGLAEKIVAENLPT